MQQQDEMMDFVWRLNAADNGAFEIKGLYDEFLQKKKDFLKIRKSVRAYTAQCDYLEYEIKKNLERLKNLNKTLGEVIDVLEDPNE